MFLTERLDTRPLMNVRNGFVISTDYESITVSLEKSLTSEEGTIQFTPPAAAGAGDLLRYSFLLQDITFNQQQSTRLADIRYNLDIRIPSPAPANIAEYIANAFIQHHSLLANVLVNRTGDTVAYRVIRPGIKITIGAEDAAWFTQTVAVQPTNGTIPNVGGGSGVFYKPKDMRVNQVIPRPLVGATGYADASEVPEWLGIIRVGDQFTFPPENNGNYLNPVKHECPEVVRRGTVQVPLEQAPPATIGSDHIIACRYALAGGATQTGGFQVLTAAPAAGSGLVVVPNTRVWAPIDDSTMLIRMT